ncbi:MAG: hypothetical protein QNJ46_18775 [Leptolyngbyaceae cyanobacterium MO_188.B28]|nr:hypothetical protein [Leptolyngbyaceae cyanobacterium MO_188.B28]
MPLWIGAEIVPHLPQASLSKFGASGSRPQAEAWVQISQKMVLIGDMARTYLDGNSLKAELATYKLAAALGVVAKGESLTEGF